MLKTIRQKAVLLAAFAIVFTAMATSEVWGQPAPIPRAVVSVDSTPEAMSGMFAKLELGDNVIDIPGAQWLQLRFEGVQLGEHGVLSVSSEDGQSQTFTQALLDAHEGLTAIFNGTRLMVTITPGIAEGATAAVAEIVIGLPADDPTALESTAPQPLLDLLGGSIDRFRPEDAPRQPEANPDAPPEDATETIESSAIEAICGTDDNRSASNHPFVGRIMPIGCTGWLIGSGALLTAGHCISSSTQTVEFNVPASQSNGTTVSPPVRDQYRVVSSSIVDGYTGIGNDWALFEVLPNTETGLRPLAAQGGGFRLSNTSNSTNLRVTGYGVDGPVPNFGNPPPRDATNQVQQAHTGALTSHTVNDGKATLRYTVDTQGGNSGSPVIVDGSNLAIGIHTNGGCGASGGSNAGTSFRNAALWAAISSNAAATGWHVCDITKTGAGWNNHYVALTCTSGPFTSKWHIMKDNQKDAMLATALSAAVSGKKVHVHIAAASSGYNVINALYLIK